MDKLFKNSTLFVTFSLLEGAQGQLARPWPAQPRRPIAYGCGGEVAGWLAYEFPFIFPAGSENVVFGNLSSFLVVSTAPFFLVQL